MAGEKAPSDTPEDRISCLAASKFCNERDRAWECGGLTAVRPSVFRELFAFCLLVSPVTHSVLYARSKSKSVNTESNRANRQISKLAQLGGWPSAL